MQKMVVSCQLKTCFLIKKIRSNFLFLNLKQNIDLQPSGPIFLTEGDPIEIPCTLDDTENYTIDDLELLYNRKSLLEGSEIIVIILLGKVSA